MGAMFSFATLTSAYAAFDVDGDRQHSISATAAALHLRETVSSNLIRLSGYGDQCTAYALDRMHEATGVWMAVTGDAYEWAAEARAAGWKVGDYAAPKSILVMPPAPGYKYTIFEPGGLEYETTMHPLGHVAWVEAVDGDWVFIKDQNWRRGQIGERWVNVKGSPMQFIYSR
jgi:surface antigen